MPAFSRGSEDDLSLVEDNAGDELQSCGVLTREQLLKLFKLNTEKLAQPGELKI